METHNHSNSQLELIDPLIDSPSVGSKCQNSDLRTHNFFYESYEILSSNFDHLDKILSNFQNRFSFFLISGPFKYG